VVVSTLRKRRHVRSRSTIGLDMPMSQGMFDPANLFGWTVLIVAGILLTGVALLGVILAVARYTRRGGSRPPA
jgi:hypothetical protein